MPVAITVLVRMVLALIVIFVLTFEYWDLLYQRIGEERTEPGSSRTKRQINGDIDFEVDIEEEKIKSIGRPTKEQILDTIKNMCLPKVICELTAMTDKAKLSESERAVIALLRDTSLTTLAEANKYHFAAHMGQLISGIDGTGCHNFYPACPFPGLEFLRLLQKVRVR